MTYQAVLKDLGIKMLTGAPFDLIKTARLGIPKKAIDALAKKLDISVSELAKYLHVSERTLQRYDPDKILSQDLSDHVLQISRVYTRCINVFENKKNAALWLKQPVIALNNTSPIELLDTSTGIEMVLEELTRLEYGAYA